MTDDLSAPLGQGSRHGKGDKSKKYGKWAALASLLGMWGLVGALGCFAVGVLGWALFAESPLGGEPMVVVAADLQPSATGPETKAAEASPGQPIEADRRRPNRYDGPPIAPGQPAVPAAASGNTVTIIDGSSGKRQDVPIPGQGGDKSSTDQRFAEPSRSGSIPRIAADGTRPSEAFAQPVKGIASGQCRGSPSW